MVAIHQINNVRTLTVRLIITNPFPPAHNRLGDDPDHAAAELLARAPLVIIVMDQHGTVVDRLFASGHFVKNSFFVGQMTGLAVVALAAVEVARARPVPVPGSQPHCLAIVAFSPDQVDPKTGNC